jgi:hypothetical protein
MHIIKFILLANIIAHGQNFTTGEGILRIMDTNYKPIDNDHREAPTTRAPPLLDF